jgi:glucokinase
MKHVIGIDVGGTHIRMSLVNGNGSSSFFHKIVVGQQRDPASILSQLAQGVRQVVSQSGVTPSAIGMGVPGIVSAERGIVYSSPHFPQWKDFFIAKQLSQILSLPVFVDNDANLLAFGEMSMGVAQDWPTFLMFTLGTGIGGGIIIDKRIFRGTRGFAGEFGHINLKRDGEPCGCGSHGCFETFFSSSALVRILKNGKFDDPSLLQLKEEVVEGDSQIGLKMAALARTGNKAALAIFSEMAIYLGIGMASLVNAFGIDRIVLGGGLIDASDLFLEISKAEMKRRTYPETAEGIEIRLAQLGDEAGILGAAFMGLEYISAIS